jgi:predicted permease
MDNLIQDLRFGFRSLRRRPLFSLIAVLTLGLGIGSATAVFSVVEGVLLRPLPFSEPQELVTVTRTVPAWRTREVLSQRWDRVSVSQPAFRRFQEARSGLAGVALYRLGARTLIGEGEPVTVSVGLGSSSLFSVLGVQPILGRTFLPEEDGAAATRVALVSEEIWMERLGGDPGILGRSVDLSGQSYTVVGVIPEGFELRSFNDPSPPYSRGFWVPIGLESGDFGEDNNWYQVIGRLAPHSSAGAAEEEASSLMSYEGGAYSYGARIRSLEIEWTGAYRRPLGLLLGSALVLLLIACGNIAALLIGETPNRHGEMATRKALGAGGRRLSQQLLTESLLLGLAGSILGIVLAVAGTRVFMSLAPPIPRLDGVEINAMVLLFSVAAGAITSIAFGLAPALQVARAPALERLKGGRRILGERGGFLHRAVISGEVTLTVLLLVAGGLLYKSLVTLMDVDTGFRREGLVEARVSLPSYLFPDGALRRQTYRTMRESLAAIPGVTEVSGTSRLPFSGRMNTSGIQIPGRMQDGEDGRVSAERRRVYPGFFHTMGVPLLAGRDFHEGDGMHAPRVAVISQAMAQRLWPEGDAVGARFVAHDTFTVVGLVGDVRHESLRADPHPTFYLHDDQQEVVVAMSLIARTDRDPRDVLPAVREAIRRVEPQAYIARLETIQTLVSQSAREERFRAMIFLAFASAAVLLAATGVFGVTARSVESRRTELGIRMALGAKQGRLTRSAVLPGMASCGIGIALGLLGALGISRVLEGFLFGVARWDPGTYGIVAAAILAVSAVATYLPSRRIGRLEPASVLRED